MSNIFATRSQVARFARRQNIESFWAVRVPNRGWKLHEMKGDVSEAREFAKGKDYINHVECHHIDEGRTPGTQPVLVLTCFKDEIPEAIPERFKIEPITPELWNEGAASNFEHRARSSTPPAPRAKSDAESPVKTVWRIADEMKNASRKEVIDACVDAGVNASTASTQYYKWSKAQK